MNSLPVDHSPARCGSSVDHEYRVIRKRPITSYGPQCVAITQADISIARPAQTRRTLNDHIQYWLNVRRRTGDHTQDLTCCCLLFQRLLQLLEQSHVLDGNDGLFGEGLEQFDLRRSEWAHLQAPRVQ